jgi:site-specific DNA-adenine methylase
MYFQYYGSKRLDLKHFQHLFPKLDETNIFVEPFCGSCSVSLHIEKTTPNPPNFHLNDNDPELINFYVDVKRRGGIKYYLDEINKMGRSSKNEFIQAIDNHPDPWVQWYANKKFRYRGQGKGSYIEFHRLNKTGPFTHKIPESDKLITKAGITCLDYMDIFNQYKDNEKAFLFLDPPYLDSFNSEYNDLKREKGQTIKDSTRVFIDILNLLKTCKCKVLFIINANAMTEYLYKPYIKGFYNKTYQMTKRVTTHFICNNYNNYRIIEEPKKEKKIKNKKYNEDDEPLSNI